ncbi:reverse transcriptase domain-containing protein [Tanacetum coccineum]
MDNEGKSLRSSSCPELWEILKAKFDKVKYPVVSCNKVCSLFLEEDLEERMNCWVKKEFKTFNDEARLSIQHWKDSWHKRMYKINHRRVIANPEEYFSDRRIVKVVRVTTDQQHMLDLI